MEQLQPAGCEEPVASTSGRTENLMGWRAPTKGLSLPEVHSSVKVGLAWHQKVCCQLTRGRTVCTHLPSSATVQVLAFSGVGVLIAVGYM